MLYVIITMLALTTLLFIFATAYQKTQKDHIERDNNTLKSLCAENLNYIAELQNSLNALNKRAEDMELAIKDWCDVSSWLYMKAWGTTYNLHRDAEEAGIADNPRFKALEEKLPKDE